MVKGVVEEATRRADSQYANVVSSLVVRHSCPAAAALRARRTAITLPFAMVPDKSCVRCSRALLASTPPPSPFPRLTSLSSMLHLLHACFSLARTRMHSVFARCDSISASAHDMCHVMCAHQDWKPYLLAPIGCAGVGPEGAAQQVGQLRWQPLASRTTPSLSGEMQVCVLAGKEVC